MASKRIPRRARSHFKSALILATIIVALPQTFAHAGQTPAKDLQQGMIALNSGAIEKALTHLTKVIEAKDRSTTDLAKALHYRAKAHHALNRPALALIDLDAALWLKKLSPIAHDDAKSLRQRINFGTKAIVRARPVAPKPKSNQKPKRTKHVAKKPPATTGSIKPATQPLMPWTTNAVATAPTKPKPTRAPTTTKPFKTTVTKTPQVSPAKKRPAQKPKLAIPNWTTTAMVAREPAKTKPETHKIPPPLPPAAVTPVRKYTTQAQSPSPKSAVAPDASTKVWPTTITKAATTPKPPAVTITKSDVVATATEPATTIKTQTQEPAAKELPSTSSNILKVVPAVESFLELSGLQQKPSSTEAMLQAAQELAKRRREKIRVHNETFAAASREAAQNQ